MKVIWKFELNPSGKVCRDTDQGNCETVDMPSGSIILSAAGQGDNICIWAEVNPEAEAKTERFEVVAPGGQVAPSNRRFIGTVLLHGGLLVLHVYHLPRSTRV